METRIGPKCLVPLTQETGKSWDDKGHLPGDEDGFPTNSSSLTSGRRYGMGLKLVPTRFLLCHPRDSIWKGQESGMELNLGVGA